MGQRLCFCTLWMWTNGGCYKQMPHLVHLGTCGRVSLLRKTMCMVHLCICSACTAPYATGSSEPFFRGEVRLILSSIRVWSDMFAWSKHLVFMNKMKASCNAVASRR